MLVGAYGTDAGLAATALLLMAYAAAAGLQIAAGSAWRWVGGARRRASDVGSLLDDGKMKTFQRATLQIFDMPHHPRRLRQAVRRWREWRRLTSRDAHSREDGEKTSRADAAGDGARAPRDRRGVSGPGARDTPERLGSGYLGAYGAAHSARDDPGYLGFTHEGERFTDDRAFADPPNARPSDGFAAARAALASCDVCRSLAPELIAKLATEHMREVRAAVDATFEPVALAMPRQVDSDDLAVALGQKRPQARKRVGIVRLPMHRENFLFVVGAPLQSRDLRRADADRSLGH